jgi:hypothetical protein
MTPAAAATLMARLAEIRAEALATLASGLPVVDSGLLRLAADASAVLAVLENPQMRKIDQAGEMANALENSLPADPRSLDEPAKVPVPRLLDEAP